MIETEIEVGNIEVLKDYPVIYGYKDFNDMNSVSFIYYNSDFEKIYEVNGVTEDNIEFVSYMTTYNNSTIVQLEKEIKTDAGYDTIYRYILITLEDFALQIYELTFDANGN